MAGEVSWWTRAKKDTEDRPQLTSLADLDQPKNGGGSTRPPEGDATAQKRVTFADGGDDESALRAAQHPSVAEFVDDALGSPPARDDGAPRAANPSVKEFVDDALGSPPARDAGAEESKAPGFVPGEAPYVTAEQELYRRALDESARLERREEERDRRRPRGCLSNPVGWCLDATSPL